MSLHRRTAALMLSALLSLTAACTGSSSAVDPTDPSEPSTSAAAGESSGSPSPGTAATGTVIADPEHAVEAPGKLTKRLLPADMLVYSQSPLSPRMIARIRALKGVVNVESMAMAQVAIEDKVPNVAAGRPGSYRRYTPEASAKLQEAWDRIAGGELGILPELRKKVPADKDGYLRLGNGATAPQIHVGAFAPQIPQVDAVVNTSWIETLGMKPGNALIVSTGITSPQSVRQPIQKIAGDKASVQILGPDLDITVQQTAFLVGSVADAVGTFNYTVLGGGRIAPDPAWVRTHISTATVPILGRVTCNRAVIPQLTAALREIVERGLSNKINPSQYAGCYYPRFIAGSTKLSNHSFGLALDLNVPGNLRGTVGEMDRTVVSIFKKWGFAWGGDWSYTDPMHFEMNALIDPR